MKTLSVLLIILFFASCSKKKEVVKMSIYDKIALDDFWRKVTGYDSVQVYSDFMNDDKNLKVNFCYPNEWEFNKWKKDTVFIHDTIYTSQHIDHVETINIDQR